MLYADFFSTYDDANLILRLYEMRREPRMREARTWFAANFKPKQAADVATLCPPGTNENASMRQVITYWDMVASFVASGVLNPELFFESGRELLLVWIRYGHCLPDTRARYGDPGHCKNLEKVAGMFIDWMNKANPGSFDALKARIGG